MARGGQEGLTRTAQRLAKVPPYLFAELDRRREEARARGIDVISFGIGDPDLPTVGSAVAALEREASNPEWHRYPPYEGLGSFRRAVAAYYGQRFGVTLDPASEVVTVIGSKEGLAHLVWAYVGPGDVSLVPDPAYPVYKVQTLLAGGEPFILPLRAGRRFLPDLSGIPDDVLKRAKLLFINYPNNPTGAVADLAFLEEAVAFCRRHELVLVSDAAYVEMTFGERAPSVLQVPGAKDVAVEFYSLSKPFNMTGWRLGAAVGNAKALSALGVIKGNTDTGQFGAVQKAGEAALAEDPASFFARMNAVYRGRLEILVQGLAELGWQVAMPGGTFYLWAPVPGGDDATFAGRLLDTAGIVVAPGSGYGEAGRGYVRFSLTVEEERIVEAIGRIRESRDELFR